MIELLTNSPLLLLFAVIALGYALGNITFRGSSLGVAAVLFVGLFFGALDSSLEIPDIVFVLGLSIFVYSLGLSSGPAFFKSYKQNGLRDFVFIATSLLFSGLVAFALFFGFDISAAEMTGAYCGSTTNTPALAQILDYVSQSKGLGDKEQLLEEAVIGYSFSYPIGVLGGIFCIFLMERFLKIDYDKEAAELSKVYPVQKNLTSVAIKITKEQYSGHTIRDIIKESGRDLVFGRINQKGQMYLGHWNTRLFLDDIVMLVGERADLLYMIDELGEKADRRIQFDRMAYDARRIFLSDDRLAGRSLASLNIDEQFQAIVTRIRRGDQDMLAHGDTVLQLGDRIRVIAKREDLDHLADYFGDSYQQASKVNLFSFGLGLGIGLLLGNVEIALGTFKFSLGYAGGPLVVGLLLGTVGRTANVVWTLPFSVNVTLQQIGLSFLLAAVGVKSGHALVDHLSLHGFYIFLIGTLISIATAVFVLWIGYRWLKIPFSLLMGIVSNQPAILDFAKSRSGNDIPNYGYTMMFPIALLGKIIIAQILFIILMNC